MLHVKWVIIQYIQWKGIPQSYPWQLQWNIWGLGNENTGGLYGASPKSTWWRRTKGPWEWCKSTSCIQHQKQACNKGKRSIWIHLRNVNQHCPPPRQIYLFHKSQGLHLKKICRTVSKTNKKWTSSLMYIIYRVSVYNYILYIYGMYYIYLFLQFIRFQNCQLIFKPKTSQTHWLTLTTCPQQPTISWAFARRSWKNRRFSAMWQFFQLEIGWVQNESCFFSNPQN